MEIWVTAPNEVGIYRGGFSLSVAKHATTPTTPSQAEPHLVFIFILFFFIFLSGRALNQVKPNHYFFYYYYVFIFLFIFFFFCNLS
jgi:hypothetical protein